MNEYEYISKKVPEGALLCQIAEEAAELAQAALKYRRTMSEENPTPVQTVEALRHLLEEAADVQLALDVWKVKYNQDGDAADDAIESTVDIKRGR
jgi:NTP pyrophosphatase (non-canonical NTP hydrolase)